MPAQSPDQPSGPTVTFDDVTKAYRDGTVAIAGISVEVASGSFVALVGASGSGKSTLLKTVNRLIAPDRGRVLLDGEDVATGAPHLLRRHIGYVFQNIGLFPHLTVADNVALPLRIAGRRDEGQVARMLDWVELPRALMSRMPAELSGGQRQRVGVARALVTEPRLMLMDEPFGALDPVTRQSLAAAVARLHRELSLTTIMVTHDMAEALLHADRILVLQAGAIVGDATPGEMLAGRGGAAGEALVAVPREQAARLAALTR